MKLNYPRTVIVGIAFLAINAFWTLYNFAMPLILKWKFDTSDTLNGIVMALSSGIAILIIPIFGNLSDKTNTKFGKKMPYIVSGIIISACSMIWIPITANKRLGFAFVLATIVTLFAMSAHRAPAVGMMPSITPEPLRAKANAVINFMGTLGGIGILKLQQALAPKPETIILDGKKVESYANSEFTMVFVVFALAMVLLIAFYACFIRENEFVRQCKEQLKKAGLTTEGIDHGNELKSIQKNQIEKKSQNTKNTKDTKKTESALAAMSPQTRKSFFLVSISIAFSFVGYNAVQVTYSRYMTDNIGYTAATAAGTLMIAQIAALIAYLPIGFISTKLGKKHSIIAGYFGMMLVFIFGYFLNGNTPKWIFAFAFAFAGISWATCIVNDMPIIASYFNVDSMGKATSYYYFFTMAGQIVTPILSGLVFDYERKYFGTEYKFLFPYAAFFVTLSWVIIIFAKSKDKNLLSEWIKEKKNKKLITKES